MCVAVVMRWVIFGESKSTVVVFKKATKLEQNL